LKKKRDWYATLGGGQRGKGKEEERGDRFFRIAEEKMQRPLKTKTQKKSSPRRKERRKAS